MDNYYRLGNKLINFANVAYIEFDQYENTPFARVYFVGREKFLLVEGDKAIALKTWVEAIKIPQLDLMFKEKV